MKVFPVVYALMTRRTEAAYRSVLEYIINLVPGGLRAINVITDYETALTNALQSVLPGVNLQRCWFHMTQASCGSKGDKGALEPTSDRSQ